VVDVLRCACLHAIGLAFAASACAPAAAWPRVVTTSTLDSRPVPTGDWISDYPGALATITSVMRRDLDLPVGDASLIFYRDRDAFRVALVQNGYDQQLAVDAAQTMTAVSGFRRVLLNDEIVDALDWPRRVALLAHELTHTLQYDVARGRRGTSDQWLREGFAEWVEIEVLIALRLTTRRDARRLAVQRVRDAGALPPLQDLVTFPQWVGVAQRTGTDAVYGQAMLAATQLIERHGAPAVVAYFARFGRSNARQANFRDSFGEDLRVFDRKFQTYLKEIR
jgi:hypothetical protein